MVNNLKIISQKEIRVMYENREEFRGILAPLVRDRIILDLENFKGARDLKLLMLEVILPMLNGDKGLQVQFFSKDLKKVLDKLIKRYYIKADYRGCDNKTRSYLIYG